MLKLIVLMVVAFAGLHGLVDGAPFNGFVPTLPQFPSNRIPGISPYVGSNGQYAEEQGQQTDNEIVKIASLLTAEKIERGEIQSNDQAAKFFTGLVSTLLSAAEKKVDPNDKVAKTFLNGFQSLLSQIGDSAGEVQTESQLTNENLSDEAEEQFISWAPVNYFYNKPVDGSSTNAEIEAYMRLPEEAKEQLWGTILTGIATHLLSKAFDGGSTTDVAAVIEALPQEAKEQLWGKILTGIATNLLSRAFSGGSMMDTAAAIEALPQEAKEQLWGKLLGGLAKQFLANKLGDLVSG